VNVELVRPPIGTDPALWGAYGGRGGLIYSWAEWPLPGEADGLVRCFACRWRATAQLRVENVAAGWAADLLACRRHTMPPRWRGRVWPRAKRFAVAVEGGVDGQGRAPARA
jgi:hypothetical protein